MSNVAFELFAKGLMPSHRELDPNLVQDARSWYKDFTGSYAVALSDREVVELYEEVNTFIET